MDKLDQMFDKCLVKKSLGVRLDDVGRTPSSTPLPSTHSPASTPPPPVHSLTPAFPTFVVIVLRAVQEASWVDGSTALPPDPVLDVDKRSWVGMSPSPSCLSTDESEIST